MSQTETTVQPSSSEGTTKNNNNTTSPTTNIAQVAPVDAPTASSKSKKGKYCE